MGSYTFKIINETVKVLKKSLDDISQMKDISCDGNIDKPEVKVIEVRMKVLKALSDALTELSELRSEINKSNH